MAGAQTQIEPPVAGTQPSPPGGAAAAQASVEQLAPAGGAVSPGESAGLVDAAGPWDPNGQRVRRILQIEVPLMVVLAQRKMAVGDILNLCIGSIIEFDKPSDEQLELMVNNRSVAFGSAVKVGENFGLRVLQIGDVKTRIDALRVEA